MKKRENLHDRCLIMCYNNIENQRVFPTCVGMCPTMKSAFLIRERFPYVRRDVSCPICGSGMYGTVFPTYVGMCLTIPTALVKPIILPYVHRDVSDRQWILVVQKEFSLCA